MTNCFFRQYREGNCGPLAIMNALCYMGEPVKRNSKIYEKIKEWLQYDPLTGTSPHTIVVGLRGVGFTTRIIWAPTIKQLEKEINKGNFFVFNYPHLRKDPYGWHIALIIGQTKKSFLAVNDGYKRRRNVQYISKKYYKRHFSDEYTGRNYHVRAFVVSKYTSKFSKKAMQSK